MTAYTVGLTGGIASGKSHVAGLFIELGVPLLEADEVAREVVAPGSPGLIQIARIFGDDILLPDGGLDRAALRAQVFADDSARKRLEAITHPLIHARVAAWRAAQTAPYCVYSAAILIESGMAAWVDRVLVVDAPEDVQRRRLGARDAASPALVEQMLAAQTSRAHRLARADDLLDNRDEARPLLPQLRRLDRLYRHLAAGRISD